MKEIRNIQMLRGVAALMIVIVHCMLAESKNLAGGILPGAFELGQTGVDLFFVISGFIMVYIQPAPLNAPRLWGRFLVHRLTRVYPPLWIVMFPMALVYLKHPELFNNYYHHKMELMRSFLLLPQDYVPPLGVAWTLIHEIYFYLVVSLALIFRPPARTLFGAVWFILVLGVFCLFGRSGFGGNRWLELIFSPFSLTFLLGYFAGLWYSARPFSGVGPGLLWGALGFTGIALAYRFVPFYGFYPDNNYLSRFLCYGLPCAVFLLAALALENATRNRLAWLFNLGNLSYALYLVHVPILTVIYKGVASLHRSVLFSSITALIFSCAASIGTAALFHRCLELRITRAARKLLETWLGLIDPPVIPSRSNCQPPHRL